MDILFVNEFINGSLTCNQYFCKWCYSIKTKILEYRLSIANVLVIAKTLRRLLKVHCKMREGITLLLFHNSFSWINPLKVHFTSIWKIGDFTNHICLSKNEISCITLYNRQIDMQTNKTNWVNTSCGLRGRKCQSMIML